MEIHLQIVRFQSQYGMCVVCGVFALRCVVLLLLHILSATDKRSIFQKTIDNLLTRSQTSKLANKFCFMYIFIDILAPDSI